MCSHAQLLHCSQQHFWVLVYCHTFRQLKKRKTSDFFSFTSICLKDCQGGGHNCIQNFSVEIRNHSINTYPQKSKMTSSLLPKLKTPLLTNTFLTLTYSHRFPTRQKQTFVYKLSLARHVSPRAGSLHAGDAGWPRVIQRDQGKPGAFSSTRSGFSRPELPLPSRSSPGVPAAAAWRADGARRAPWGPARSFPLIPPPGPSPARPSRDSRPELGHRHGAHGPRPAPLHHRRRLGPAGSAARSAPARGAAPPSP